MSCAANRWPTIYDFHDLESQIKTLIERGLDGFYTATPDNNNLFQGDIIELSMDFPYIDEVGNIVAYDVDMWLILGNTCDITREEFPYTNIIPLQRLDADTSEDILMKLKRFQSYKKIYLPDSTGSTKGYIADFTEICSIDKKFLSKNATKINELDYPSWVLFHSCVIRYFARDDGRND